MKGRGWGDFEDKLIDKDANSSPNSWKAMYIRSSQHAGQLGSKPWPTFGTPTHVLWNTHTLAQVCCCFETVGPDGVPVRPISSSMADEILAGHKLLLKYPLLGSLAPHH